MPYSFHIEKDTEAYLSETTREADLYGRCLLCGEPIGDRSDLYCFRTTLPEGPCKGMELSYPVHRSRLKPTMQAAPSRPLDLKQQNAMGDLYNYGSINYAAKTADDFFQDLCLKCIERGEELTPQRMARFRVNALYRVKYYHHDKRIYADFPRDYAYVPAYGEEKTEFIREMRLSEKDKAFLCYLYEEREVGNRRGTAILIQEFYGVRQAMSYLILSRFRDYFRMKKKKG